MLRFSRLAQELESAPFNRSAPERLAAYLASVPAADARWALFLLLGGRLPELVDAEWLKAWVLRETALPSWLWDESRENAADSVEASALLLTTVKPGSASADASLTSWIEEITLPLAERPRAERQERWAKHWRELGDELAWTAAVLATGRFPVRVSRKTVEDTRSPLLAELDTWLGSASARAAVPGGARRALDQLDLFTDSRR